MEKLNNGRLTNMDKIAWQKIQKAEIEYHLQKDESRILEVNLGYWRSLLAKVEPFVRIADGTRVLDAGCGCCGVLMALDRGTLVGVDPLMDQYLEHFSFLRGSRAAWVTGTAEELDSAEPFDVIFSINALDHTYDPALAARNLDRLLRNGGHMVISLNCHNTAFFHRYYRLFYRAIDRHHPHHFRPSDITALFPRYRAVVMEDIDCLFLDREAEYRETVLRQKRVRWGKVLSYMFNPLKYPIALARILGGRPVHRKRAGDKAIFSNYLFVLQKGSK